MSDLVLPYADPFGTGTRPYLSLRVIGINGASEPIIGLVDSGADVTCLPMELANLLGYGPSELEPAEIRQVAGGVDALRATVPAEARVIGLERLPFPLQPVFIEGCSPLWGREDFFHAFEAVGIREADSQLGLSVRD